MRGILRPAAAAGPWRGRFGGATAWRWTCAFNATACPTPPWSLPHPEGWCCSLSAVPGAAPLGLTCPICGPPRLALRRPRTPFVPPHCLRGSGVSSRKSTEGSGSEDTGTRARGETGGRRQRGEALRWRDEALALDYQSTFGRTAAEMASVGARWGWVCAWSTRSRFRHTAQRPASGGRQQAARWLRSQRVQTGAHSESARPSCRWGGSTAMGNRCRKEATGARRALIQLRGQCSHSAAPSVTF